MRSMLWFCTQGTGLYDFLEDVRKERIPCIGQHCRKGKFYAKVWRIHWRRLTAIAAAHGLTLEVVTEEGLHPRLRRFRWRVGIPVGLALALAFLLFFSNLVLSVEITGNQTVPTAEIERALSEVGIHRGALIPSINFHGCEVKMRLHVSDLTWIGIRHTGGHIIVDVREETPLPEMADTRTPCNYVASRTAYIHSMRAYRGQVMRKEGEAVKEGEVILSGVVEEENGAMLLCHADGMVIGEYEERLTFSQPFCEQKRVETEGAIARSSFSFFGFRVPMQLGSPPGEPYSYAEDYQPFALLGHTLPFGIVHATYQPYQNAMMTYTPDQAQALLEQKLERYEQNFHAKDEILSREVIPETQEGGLACTAIYQIRGEIGTSKPIFLHR